MSHGFMWCFLSYSSAGSFVIATMILIQIYLYFYSNFSVAWGLEVCLCFSVGDIICCCLVSLTHAASAYIRGSARSILSPFIQVSLVFLSYGLGGSLVPCYCCWCLCGGWCPPGGGWLMPPLCPGSPGVCKFCHCGGGSERVGREPGAWDTTSAVVCYLVGTGITADGKLESCAHFHHYSQAASHG